MGLFRCEWVLFRLRLDQDGVMDETHKSIDEKLDLVLKNQKSQIGLLVFLFILLICTYLVSIWALVD